MQINKSILSIAIATALTATIASPVHADVINMDYNGLFTWMGPSNKPISNSSMPYYSDPTWGFGLRTQISGTLQYDTVTEYGSATIDPFDFANSGDLITTDFTLQSIGSGRLLGNMNFAWGGSVVTTQIVLDGSGLFAGIDAGLVTSGNTLNTSSCATGGSLHDGTNSLCATAATDGIKSGSYPIGPLPVASSSLNTMGQTGFGTTLGQLSLGTDDDIGGSPMDNGPFVDHSFNYDFTSLTVTSVSSVPVPAAVWLFGSGLLGLIAVARRKV